MFQLYDLAEIFNKRMFRIPDFQRGYSWDIKQLEEFWMDLIELGENRCHYLGVLTVEEISKSKILDPNDLWLIDEKQLNPYFIIDGQQRITTCIILITALIDCNADIGEDEYDEVCKKYLWILRKSDQSRLCVFGYDKTNPSNEYWKTEVLKILSTSNESVLTSYTRNLKFAYEFFSKKLKDCENTKLLYKKLTGSLKFNFYKIDPLFDVYVAFETMNNRGKDLSKLELLKNRLIYLTTILLHYTSDNLAAQTEVEALRVDINNVWKTIYEFLGKKPEFKLEDDAFLKDHWVMYFGFKKEQSEEFALFLLNNYFTPKNVQNGRIKALEISNYIKSLQTSVRIWYKLHSCETANKDEADVISSLNVLGYKYFKPIILAAYQKNQNPPIELMRTIENFIFLAFNISQRRSDYKHQEFMQLANSLLIQEEIRGDKCDRPYVRARLLDLIAQETKVDKFVDHVNELFEEKNGFYDWSGLNYFMYVYEKDLFKSGNEENERLIWNSNKTKEHIFPQDEKISVDYWNSRFSQYSAIHIRYLRNSLGNLVLLNRSKNSALSRKPFPEKKVMYQNGTFSEIEIAKYDDWNAGTIIERSLILMRYMEKKWNIRFGSDQEKMQLLHLDKINSAG